MNRNFGRQAARVFVLVAAPCFALFPLKTQAEILDADARVSSPGIVRATLDNGLRVVIVRNTLAPVVSTNVNYLVGADETPEGFPGMAHAQEHMMFRGSPGLTGDQLADIGSVMGGNFNADTRQTVTQYFYTVPAEDLDVALQIEALRMKEVLATDDDWARERGAIEQEVAQDVSSPEYVLSTMLREAIFAGSTYAHDGLGTRPSFEVTTAAMLKEFHDRWYAPNNAILVVVGNVDPEAALAKVKVLFGAIPAKVLPARPRIEFSPVVPQELKLDSDLPYGAEVIALRFPGLESPDFAAVEVLVDILKSQRGDLYELVPKGKALGTDFSFDPSPKASLAYALAAFPAAGDAKALEQDMRSILKKIAANGVPPDLVAAAKLTERRGAEFQKTSIGGLATVWSEAVALYGLDDPDDDLVRIEKVTVEDVNRVARKYLDLDHAVTAVLSPHGSGKTTSSSGFGGQESIALGEGNSTQLPDWAAGSAERLVVPASTVHPAVSVLDNGVTLIVQPEDVSDTVSIYGHVSNRPELQVPKGKEGLSELLTQLFPYGSQRLDRIAFQRALDAIGADESAGTDFALQVLSDNFPRGVELLADNLLHPALPKEAFEITRRQVAETIAGELTSPSYLSERALRAALFPKHDPTLREALPETVNAISLKDVRDYYNAVFRPDMTTIVVIGRITPERAQEVIAKYFGGWAANGAPPRTALPAVPLNDAAASAVPDESRVQDKVTLAETLGLTRLHPDYYALELGNNVLGGAFYSTRLTRDIRKEAGLVYSIQSSFEFSQTRGLYTVTYACDPQNVEKVHRMAKEEVRRMQLAPVGKDELLRVKALMLRRIPLDEASFDDIAHGLLAREALGLPLDEPTIAARRYLELGASEVQAAFKKWLRPEALVRVSQGPGTE
jgi:zinc protease